MIIRDYDPNKDQKAAHRIWEEIDWIDRDDKDDKKYLDIHISGSRSLVAEINGAAECMVNSSPGTIQYLEEELPIAIVASVCTSLVGRKQGLASRLTAKLVAEDAENGALVSVLGMFEQGYYSRLGFGTGPYEHFISFDPTQLTVDYQAGVPIRISKEDYKDVYQAMLNRRCEHGAVKVLPIEATQWEMGVTEKPFGLGYRDKDNILTHFIWGKSKGEFGPYVIKAIAYQNRDQLLELLALIRTLGDQILTVQMLEPPHVQMQDFLKTPFRRQNATEGSRFKELIFAEAYWQARVNDIEGCIAKTRLRGRTGLSFNLELDDPIEQFLDDDQKWRGVSGSYTVHLGEESSASKGHDDSLPSLKASVSGFSRLWLGCSSAKSISLSGEIQADDELIAALDNTLCLPLPKAGWEY